MTPEIVPLSSPASVRVIRALLGDVSGRVTRERIAVLTGLSPAAVTRAVRPLLAAGYVVEVAAEFERPARGRPVRLLEVVGGRAHTVGVQVTATEVIGVDVDFVGVVRSEVRRRIDSHDPDSVVAVIAEVVRALRAGGREDAVCVLLSGDVERSSGTVHFSPFLGWRSVPLGRLLEDALGVPVEVENDVRALTAREQLVGAGRHGDSFLLVTLGVGVGCGMSVAGTLVEGTFGVSGELGHVVVDPGGPACYCGSRGCLEQIAADPALLRAVQAAHPDVSDLEAAHRLAEAGDPATLSALRAAGAALGRGLAAAVNLLGPRFVVLRVERLAETRLRSDTLHETFTTAVYGAASRCEILVQDLPAQDWAHAAASVALLSHLSSSRARFDG